MTLTSVSDDTKKQQSRLQWRRSVIRRLQEKGFAPVAENFRNCGCSFFIDTCSANPSHSPKSVPVHCGNRFCEDCERRESYRKLNRYLPALNELLQPNPTYPDHFLFKLTLTTPYLLTSLTAETFKQKQSLVNEFFKVYFYQYFEKRGELSKAEIRRQRCDLKKHGIGGLIAAEFGEKGKKLHWHLLVYAPYMPHETILTLWRAVTGGECKFARVNGIYARENIELKEGGDIIGAIQEVLKYSTKFSAMSPYLVPKLHAVLKGNRRFRTFGVLYATPVPDSEELDHSCEECHAERQNISVGTYIHRCELANVPVSDEVAETVENGVFVYFSREPEISSGKPDKQSKKARDALESSVT